uniref:Uncharacterized protein n=1 Tax=Lactuca sativa TaxID=4236 RepID=A0A9R1X9B5_LACSA|nr:hypothetical protein LSAT_V11C500249280 [Lactuca sativa]
MVIRKLNSFYLDNTKNISLGTTSTHLSSTTTGVNTSIYKDKLSNSSSAANQYSLKLVTDAYKDNISFNNYATSKLPNKRQHYVLSNDMTSKNNILIMVIKMFYIKHVMQSYGEMNSLEAHINVEWCNQGSFIKYLFKYINNGPDRATVLLYQQTMNVKLMMRYLSACEASLRIFKYDVHCSSVVRLSFHLPNRQHIVYGEDDDIDDVLDKSSIAASKFTSWMECMQLIVKHENLHMLNFLQSLFGFWKRRKVGKVIGRIHSVSPNLGKAYFLRILLNKVKGPTSFDEIRTVNGETYSSFGDACYAHGLLDDDKEYIDAIKEASHFGSEFLFLINTH